MQRSRREDYHLRTKVEEALYISNVESKGQRYSWGIGMGLFE